MLCTFGLTVFTQRNFAADFLRAKSFSYPKNENCRLRGPLGGGGLGATYAVHLRLMRKLVGNFPLFIIELFSLGVTAEPLLANID